MKKVQPCLIGVFWGVVLLLFPAWPASGHRGGALVLQELSWKDVQGYLKTNDMVIIPIGSTEQHGPHLPLGTDAYIAVDVAKRISERTGVLVAPVVLAGYSLYHKGFPGTLSLKPDTMERVLYETAEILIGYGFRRIMFLNAHGGNRIVESRVVHRINQNTPAVAATIGIGSPVSREEDIPEDWFDQHAGPDETSMMLFLEPGLVRMDRAEKPRIRFTPQMRELLRRGRENPALMSIFWSLLATPEETGKGGASHQISSNGVWALSDPRQAAAPRGEALVSRRVEDAVSFIEAWKPVKSSKTEQEERK